MQWIFGTHEGRHYPQVLLFQLRDVKPANILLTKGTVKIGDFGFAKRNVSRKMKS